MGTQKRDVAVQDRAARAEVARRSSVHVRSPLPGDGAPMEAFLSIALFQDAEPGGVESMDCGLAPSPVRSAAFGGRTRPTGCSKCTVDMALPSYLNPLRGTLFLTQNRPRVPLGHTENSATYTALRHDR